jgi:protoporphyrinogen/coproporphyrinogen III oxidase
MKIAVIGGGISGLSAAYRLRRSGVEAVVLEAAPDVGGKIKSERTDGFLVEHGPNGFLDSRVAVVRLARDVGLGGRILHASDAAKDRFLFVDGHLKAVPSSPPAFLTSDILSVRGRLRVLWEYFVSARRDTRDESIFDFAARRIGPEAAERLVDAMVTGIFAGDSRQLSLPAAFPQMARLEREFGGLFKGMKALRKERSGGPNGPRGRLASFQGGLTDLVSACVNTMDSGAIHCGRPVSSVVANGDGRWRVLAQGGDALIVDGVVFTTPTPMTAQLVGDLSPSAATALEGITYAPAAVVALGYPESALDHPLDGFGFLVPSLEKRDILGVLWSSTLFADRAPDGQILLRTIVGGARRPELVGLDDEALVATVAAELSVAFGCDLMTPSFERIGRWPQGIPQYTMGHLDRVTKARAALSEQSGLFIAGNGVSGVSLADCAAAAETLPDEIRNQLGDG